MARMPIRIVSEYTVERSPQMETIQVVLDTKLLRATDLAARRQKVNRSALIRHALEKLPPKRLRKLGLLCGVFLLNRGKPITEPFRFPLQCGRMPFPALLVPLLPNGLVVFDLVLDHRVEDHRDLVRRSRMCGLRPDLGFHSP